MINWVIMSHFTRGRWCAYWYVWK